MLNENKVNITINNKQLTPVAQPHTYKEALLMKADTGASGHYVASKDKHKIGIKNLRRTTTPKVVLLPNQETIQSTHDSELVIPIVSHQSKSATIFPNLTNASLLSIGKLCDDDCTAIFTKEDMKVMKEKEIVLEGKRNKEDGLWDVQLNDTPAPEQLNAII